MKEDHLEMLFSKSIGASKIDEYYKNLFNEIESELRKTLNEEEGEIFLDYIDAHHQYIIYCSMDFFKRGFWVGHEMMRELNEM
ncbi:MAG: hypothetical protein FWH08_01115 [Oscillospiraceae bacterium]|nr:hypothetical protein [Oscillospiraceae bacterium]